MSIEQAYNSLRCALAREAKMERGVRQGSPSDRDFWIADVQINSMSHTALLFALSQHENTT